MNTTRSVARTREPATLTPPVDIYDAGEEVVLHADMPGVSQDNLEVNFDRGQLTIHGHVEPRAENASYMLREFSAGDYHRVFAIGEDIDPSGITAELKHGVLTLHLAKLRERAPVKVTVKAG